MSVPTLDDVLRSASILVSTHRDKFPVVFDRITFILISGEIYWYDAESEDANDATPLVVLGEDTEELDAAIKQLDDHLSTLEG